MRFETNPAANDHFGRATLAAALFAVGAKRVRLRCAYGLGSMPQVVTFAADSMEHADRLATAVQAKLGGELPHPALWIRQYTRR